MILPFTFTLPRHIFKHIFNKDPIPRGGVADQDVGDGAHELAILDNGAARHECGQERTTNATNL